jgi:hypothetical protein
MIPLLSFCTKIKIVFTGRELYGVDGAAAGHFVFIFKKRFYFNSLDFYDHYFEAKLRSCPNIVANFKQLVVQKHY